MDYRLRLECRWRVYSLLNAGAAYIAGIEYYLPQGELTNDELAAAFPEWPAKKILTKTGIETRHIAADSETAADLAFRAAEQLFLSNKCKPEEVDFILLCTQYPDYFLPPSACILQHRLGIPQSAGALDVNLGCSGFVYGLALAQALVQSGTARAVLLLTADTYSKFIHQQDKSVRTLFGDAAAATLIRSWAGSGKPSRQHLGPFVLGTDGSGADRLIVQAGAARLPRSAQTGKDETDSLGSTRSQDNLYMDGAAIYGFTLRQVPDAVDKLLTKAGLAKDDVDLFVFHQANKYMLEVLCKECKIDPAKFVFAMSHVGNTVSSTIPIALAEAQRRGQLRPGRRIMLVGFGVGLSWAAGMATVPKPI